MSLISVKHFGADREIPIGVGYFGSRETVQWWPYSVTGLIDMVYCA